MTARQLYEYALIELNKVEAPSMLLEDYNYFINKAVLNYVNKRYNIYDVNQQVSDDLRVLAGTAVITDLVAKTGNPLQAATYIGVLPQDYFHLLNCIAQFTAVKRYKCNAIGSVIYQGVKRLTSGMYSDIISNAYLKPSFKNPYFYLHSDAQPAIDVNVPGTPDEIRQSGDRDGNASPINIEIRYGTDKSIFVLSSIYIDYLRVPATIRITQDQVDANDDTSATIEFPDYVCNEIVKELVVLLMENASDQRLNTNPLVNQSIAGPPQAQQQGQPAQQR